MRSGVQVCSVRCWHTVPPRLSAACQRTAHHHGVLPKGCQHADATNAQHVVATPGNSQPRQSLRDGRRLQNYKSGAISPTYNTSGDKKYMRCENGIGSNRNYELRLKNRCKVKRVKTPLHCHLFSTG